MRFESEFIEVTNAIEYRLNGGNTEKSREIININKIIRVINGNNNRAKIYIEGRERPIITEQSFDTICLLIEQ